jgi:TRAP-type mannitol/chloroaromatic compound transport system substrate-binding protein
VFVKNKFLLTLVALTLTLSMVFGILIGCGGGATPTATTTGPTTPGATVKPGQTTVAPPPTKAGEVFNWRYQSLATAGSPNWWLQKDWCEWIKIASGGRLVLEPLVVGSVLNTQEVFDGVSSGAIEVGGSCDPYWSGKDMRFEIQGMIAGHFTQLVQLGWFYQSTEDDKIGKGLKYARDLFGRYNIMYFIWSLSEAEVEYMANKPIIKATDYKGLTFRGTGWTQKTIQEFGAKGVFIPPADVYSSLQTGVIDACELGNLYSNYAQGYYDITKYTGFPGLHKLCETSGMMVNMDEWNKLPADLQMIFELSCSHFCNRNQAFYKVLCAEIIPKLIDKGITITYTDPTGQDLWHNTSWALAEKEAEKSPEFKTMWEDMKEFQFTLDRYLQLQTPHYGSDYPGNMENIKGIKFQ